MIILCLLLISLFFSSAIFFLEMEPNISLNLNLNIKQHIKCYLINKNVDKYGELFINDKDLNVRYKIAENGNQKCLDKLVFDEYFEVRERVARRNINKYLDILVSDSSWSVRNEVVKQRNDKYLDILVYDEDWRIRHAVAKQGIKKYLDILINDENEDVRYEVVKYGNLEQCQKLLNDKCEKVRNYANDRTSELKYRELCEKKNKERKSKREALINNEINDKPNNKIVQYEIIQ